MTYINVLGVTMAILPGDYAYIITDEYINAWGWYCIAGTLADLRTGETFTNQLATGSHGARRDDVLMSAARSIAREEIAA